MSSLSEDPSVVVLLRVEEQEEPIATPTAHSWQDHTKQGSVVSVLMEIGLLESQGVIAGPTHTLIAPYDQCKNLWRVESERLVVAE